MAATIGSKAKGFGDERYRLLIAKLIEARQAKGLTQQKLADMLERHQQFVSRYELGERRLDVVEFADVARALDLDAAALIGQVT
jgi:transcriptional regulator with XRE-family HTH domain